MPSVLFLCVFLLPFPFVNVLLRVFMISETSFENVQSENSIFNKNRIAKVI